MCNLTDDLNGHITLRVKKVPGLLHSATNLFSLLLLPLRRVEFVKVQSEILPNLITARRVGLPEAIDLNNVWLGLPLRYLLL